MAQAVRDIAVEGVTIGYKTIGQVKAELLQLMSELRKEEHIARLTEQSKAYTEWLNTLGQV